MSEELKFSEEGFKLHESLAKMMDEGLEAHAAGAALGLSMSGVIGAAAFVLAMIKFMTDDSDQQMVEAMKTLQRQIDEIKDVLVMLDDRIDALVDQVAIQFNRDRLSELLDYLDSVRQLDLDLIDRPDDLDTAVRVAAGAGIICDKFLRSDFDLWRWTDVVEKPYVNPSSGQTTMQNALALGRFKNMPTLPVYAAALLTWLGAREKVVRAGQRSRLGGDQTRLERHRAATAVRPEFDKYAGDNERSTPITIPEHIKYRIRAYPIASSRQARDRICQFYFDAGNMMTGKRKAGEGFDMVMPPGTVFCTLDPDAIGSPALEIDMELAAGIETLRQLTDLLGRLANGDSLRGQLIGVFPNTEVFAPAVLYVVDDRADLQWYRHESAAARGGSRDWTGPKKVGNGWGGFSTVFNGGGPSIYGIKPDGTLLWYSHDGHAEGGQNWRGPKPVGSGWQGFKSVFSGGENIVYAIQPDGRLLWYRHDGAGQGTTAWTGPLEVGTGWQDFQRVFAGGDGTIYAIRPDGVLERCLHKGYLDGSPNWAPTEEIGTGWGGFRDVVAASNGVLYAFTRDRKILWYRYGKRPPLPPEQRPEGDVGIVTRPGNLGDIVVGGRARQRSGLGGLVTELNPGVAIMREEPNRLDVVARPNENVSMLVNPDAESWEGPVEIRRNFPAFRAAFVRMSEPYRGPN